MNELQYEEKNGQEELKIKQETERALRIKEYDLDEKRKLYA
jgi:hypothetical protein